MLQPDGDAAEQGKPQKQRYTDNPEDLYRQFPPSHEDMPPHEVNAMYEVSANSSQALTELFKKCLII
ncbi:hypothetical protein GURASL_06340 [Geotalea uraniireducens]|uniref:Uncharacterized protein n=1 Tax=Geotalea uraniireducens TaxID=351604 RepID=A0ABN6VSC7_9BACT|nr:hypothetical protein GURASL_06340 [Geotalea uraniireducens]